MALTKEDIIAALTKINNMMIREEFEIVLTSLGVDPKSFDLSNVTTSHRIYVSEKTYSELEAKGVADTYMFRFVEKHKLVPEDNVLIVDTSY